jgi:O-antigen ligase
MSSPVVGDGLAAFPARGLGVYPHNIFLETFCEAGVIGMWLLGLVFVAGMVSLARRKHALDTATLSALVFILAASQFSGDFYDNGRSVFLFLLAVARPSARDVTPQGTCG